MLVDEIQSDTEDDINRIVKNPEAHISRFYTDNSVKSGKEPKKSVKEKAEILKANVKRLQKIVKNFNNIAVQVVTDFANKNGIKKIVWHTYESGKTLKQNRSPKSLYEKLPKDHYFKVSEEERPFHLPEKILGKRS